MGNLALIFPLYFQIKTCSEVLFNKTSLFIFLTFSQKRFPFDFDARFTRPQLQLLIILSVNRLAIVSLAIVSTAGSYN